MKLIVNLLITAVSAVLLEQILPGIQFDNFGKACIFALVLGIFNVTITPLLKILGLPLTILTFGLFSLVITAAVTLFTANILNGVFIDGFWWALLFSILLSFVTSLINRIIYPNKKSYR